jgi:RHS repeat-associated protein
MRAPGLLIVVSASLLFAVSSPALGQISVAIIPDNGPHPDPVLRLAQSTNDTVKFYIKNTSPSADVHFAVTCARSGNVTVVTTCIPASPIISAGDSLVATVVFSVGAIGSGRVDLTATSTVPAGATATGGWDITIVGPTVVTPKDSLSTVLPSSMGNQAVFKVKNNRAVTGSYSFSRLCNGAATSCSLPSPDSLSIAAGASGSTTVTYSATATVGDTGHVRLIASSSGAANDTGSVRVVVTNVIATPVINAVDYNPGRALPREQCLTISLGEAAAAECGDLRVVHQLPMFKTFNVERRPVLLYNSATAQAIPEVAIRVTVPSLTQLPDTINVALKVGGVLRGQQRWGGGPWDVKGVPRYLRVRDTTVPGTGLIKYTVEVTSIKAGAPSLMSSTTQEVLVVNRQASPYGNGWWIAGLEQLFITTADTMVWVGGDGSARVYARPGGSGAWTAPSITYPDIISKVGTTYIRQLPDSVWVFFGAAGRQDSTRNRSGHVTRMTYDGSGRLLTLNVPSTGGVFARGYSFVYGTGYYILLDSGFRPQTTIWRLNGRVDSIIGLRAPKDSVTFGYAAGTNFMARRTDRRGGVRRFDLDVYGKVRGARFGPNGPGSSDPLDSIIVALTPTEALGFSTVGSSDSVGFHTSYDGPRRPLPAPGGVNDTTAFWVNRFGAPTRIVSALRDSTRLDRSNATFPGLVTRLKTGTGQVILAAYDARGRITSVNDSTFAQATTVYQWDAKWDQLTLVAPPEKDSVFFTLNAANGDRVSQRDVRGVGSRIDFSYDPVTRQVNLITGPGTSFQGFHYDGFGDVDIIGTQSGYQQKFTQDYFGRTTIRQIQIDVGATKWLQDSIVYDLFDRDTVTFTRISTAPTDSQVVVRKYYDAESNLDSLTRRYKTPSGFESLTTLWVTDRAGRRILERAPDGHVESYRYDSASNDTSTTTRRGDVISMQYDALNRLTTRVVPQYVYAPRTADISPPNVFPPIPPYTYTAPRSIDTLTYAADGQVTTASNRFAKVARQYNASGLLLSETLSIQKADTTGFGPHVYLTKYEYDRNRRRVSLIVPRLFKGPVTDTMRFSYYPWGGAYQTQDVSGLLSAYLYTPRSELMEIIYPGSIVHDLQYNDDGNYARDNVLNLLFGPSGTFPRVANKNLRDQTFTSYDARAKLLASTDTTQYQDQVTATYGDLGFAATTVQSQKGVNATTGNPTTYVATDSMFYDGIGNLTRTSATASGTTGFSGGTYILVENKGFTYLPGTGRLSQMGDQNGVTTYSYDTGASQTVFESTQGSGGVVAAERASFFGADGRLMQVDRRVPGHRIVEDYWYDALGRRIWTRTRVTCAPISNIDCGLSRVRRTVWDGGQELAEIQVPDTVGAVENDSSRITVPPLQPNGGFADPNPFFGRVLYTPGWAVDQPLSVTRFGYNDVATTGASADTTWSTFTIFPHWDTRGVPTLGTFGDGAVFHPKGTVGGQTQCPIPYTDATNRRCVFVIWPFGYSAYDLRRGLPPVYSWHGSLLENKRDASGFDYKRNRVYDPTSGRFTQEDPIGLAGGLNAYGFVGGDPVNFSDPFGLQGCKDHPNSPTCKDAIASMGALDDPLFNLLLFVFTAGGSGAARAALATREARALGAAGETAAGIVKNTERIASATGSAAWRIPDALTTTTLTEVKNVARLSLTNQIRDFAAFAEKEGHIFELVIRKDTKLTGPLLDFIREKGIQVRFLP